nr:uncharacterized protein ycf45 [Ipomoea batatas]
MVWVANSSAKQIPISAFAYLCSSRAGSLAFSEEFRRKCHGRNRNTISSSIQSSKVAAVVEKLSEGVTSSGDKSWAKGESCSSEMMSQGADLVLKLRLLYGQTLSTMAAFRKEQLGVEL